MKELIVSVGPIAALLAQGGLMSVDEGLFHRWRGLSRLESWSHLIDTSLFVVTMSIGAFLPPTDFWLTVYVACALLSSLLVTKDEWIHAKECSPGEHWLHAVQFVVHPLVLVSFAGLWLRQEYPIVRYVAALAPAVLGLHMWWYWIGSGRARRDDGAKPIANNDFYDELGALWFEGDHHSQALYRRENVVRLAYIRETLNVARVSSGARILDVGCGAGLVSAPLAADGFEVKGIDCSAGALAAARAHVPARVRLQYALGDAYQLDEPADSYDVVLLLSMLDRLEEPQQVLREAVRVLKPGGLLLFDACNRTLRSWLMVVHGVKLMVRDVPPRLHVHRLFIKPAELEAMGQGLGLSLQGMRGIRPRIFHHSLPLTILDHKLHPEFSFVQSRSLATGYVGYFQKPVEARGASTAAVDGRREGNSQPAGAGAALAN